MIFAGRQEGQSDACNWTPLYEDAMYAVLPESYPTGDRKSFSISEFDGKDFLMPYGRFDIEVGAAFRANGVKPNIRPSHVDDETVIRMVGKGLGITMMTEMMLRGRTDGVKILPLEPRIVRELGMGMHLRENMPRGVPRLRDCVLDFSRERARARREHAENV